MKIPETAIIITERCYLRPFELTDAKAFYEMNNDPEVLQYTGDDPFSSVEDAKDFISNYTAYTTYGYGRWAVCKKDDGAFIGFCGLKYHKNGSFVEVGYRFKRTFWNLGYATETAKACIDFAFNVIQLPIIYCQVWEENKASIRVAEKLGFEFEKAFEDHGKSALRFKQNNPLVFIKEIDALATYDVRHPVLRKDRPVADCAFDGDNLATTFHLGIYYKNGLVGVATFLASPNNSFSENNQYQLRGMAILDEFQKKGYGEQLLKKGEAILHTKNVSRLWFNAREIAVSFYQRLDYHTSGSVFDIPNIGNHYVMTKIL